MPLLVESVEDRLKLLIGNLLVEREALAVQLEQERARADRAEARASHRPEPQPGSEPSA